jgi:MYXO-CTERM domain-containing protein
MAVPVPAGRHELALTYRNTQVGRGTADGAAALAVLLAGLAWRRRVTQRAERR